jgi:hypothetical protein
MDSTKRLQAILNCASICPISSLLRLSRPWKKLPNGLLKTMKSAENNSIQSELKIDALAFQFIIIFMKI